MGMNNGYFYLYWKDIGMVLMILGFGGNYSVNWNFGFGNFVGGKGWCMGLLLWKVNYNVGVWVFLGNVYLILYGWIWNLLIEYYVVDSWGSWCLLGGIVQGLVIIDGGIYDFYWIQCVNQLFIEGIKMFYQYWSV